MDLGSVTLLVAVVFSSIGIAIGIGISKLFSKSKEEADVDFEFIQERIETLARKIENLVSNIEDKVNFLREENLKSFENEIKKLIDDLKKLKQDLVKVEASNHTYEVLDKIIRSLSEIDYEVPKSNEALLTQIKDSFLIVRNDLEMILSNCKNSQRQESNIKESLNTAVELAKKINKALVGSELLSLADSVKGNNKEIVKLLDEQAINSKELVTILEGMRQQIGE
jgi:hypothetical protein